MSTITSVAVVCSPASVLATQTSSCTATVQGTGSYSSAVNWTATDGTVTASGTFTPTAAGTATITATSTQDATKSGTATVVVGSPTAKDWTWTSGSSMANGEGIYGTLGAASSSNVPGARSGSVSWTDASGNLWLFGGFGGSNVVAGDLNDLWEFNPSSREWTWVNGSDTGNAFGGFSETGIYGTKGVASPSNVPPPRNSAVSWTDTGGNFWLFGGYGYDSTGMVGYLNDLWQFNPTTKTWTWVGGSDAGNASGVYGTLGVASVTNVPGARSYSVSWTDSNGNFWLYGGEGYGPSGQASYDLSDLWEFSPPTKQWTWVNGTRTGGVAPAYGVQGVASDSNTPGGRDSAVGWADGSGNLWLFGGFDYDSPAGENGTNQYLNDLWEFSPATKQWTWVGGSDTGGAKGVYGTLGTPSVSNTPGARGSEGIPVTWTDSSGDFWLFGGVGYDSTGTLGPLNDLWRYQP